MLIQVPPKVIYVPFKLNYAPPKDLNYLGGIKFNFSVTPKIIIV